MSNILNTHLAQNNNQIAAKKLKDGNSKKEVSSVIEAPQSLYKYSVYKDLQDAYEYRKELINYNTQNNMKKRKFSSKVVFVAAASALLLFFKTLKNIKKS